MKKVFLKVTVFLMVAVLIAAFTLPASACVGRTITIGSKPTPQQELLAQILAVLITERTGTTVKIVNLDSTAAAHQALMRADVDMYVEYTGIGQMEVLGKEAIADPSELYQAVKAAYAQDLNLVWLERFGFEESRVAPSGASAQAAPVVRRDTLQKFPALPRLLNRLGGLVDNDTMRDMETQLGSKSPQEVAREFLRGNRLI